MKKAVKGMMICFLLVVMAGCQKEGKPSGKRNPGSQVDQVLKEQTQKQSAKKETSVTEQPTPEPEEATVEPTQETEEELDLPSADGIDIDMTQMNSDMVYGTVYQLMVDPDTYVGKTIRIAGTFYNSHYDKTGKDYQFCIIKDAMACCSQGMEFIWGDGTHKYPEDYPAENTEIEVTGTFETYKEQGDDTLYVRLANADMKVKK